MIFQQVPVTIYYESLCPDSQAFIANQVYPTLKTELKDYVDITWVPFGKTTVRKLQIKKKRKLSKNYTFSLKPVEAMLPLIVTMEKMSAMATKFMLVPWNIFKPIRTKMSSQRLP